MNLDEFLKHTSEMALSNEEITPGRALVLLAIVRKLREQRDEAFTELANALEGAGPSRSDMAKANAALDEIVRGG